MNELAVNEIKIENMIYEIRGKQVMLDSDLARLYQIETKNLNKAVNRNIDRFPLEFMFQLTYEEYNYLRFQIGTSNMKGGRRYIPYVFTEQGVAMLASVLHTDVAIKTSIKIINAFVAMRHYIGNNEYRLSNVEAKVLEHDNDIKLLQESFQKFEEKKVINEIYFNGQIYDAYSKIIDIFKEAKHELIIIDGYSDKTVLDMIKELTCKIILITKKNSNLKGLDIEKYNTQYHNLNIIYNDTFHDRYFIIDKEIIYHSGTSINHAGSKTFSVNILEDELVKETLLNKIEEITDGGKYE